MITNRSQKLVLGFAQWGNTIVDKNEMKATVKLAIESGVTEIDCAPHYGNGAQELVLGEALQELPSQLLANVKISTKVGRIIDQTNKAENTNGFTNTTGFAQRFDYSKTGILTSFKQSQERLKVDNVHTLYLHDIDAKTHGNKHDEYYEAFVKEGYSAFEELKKDNKITVSGIGTNDVDICLKLIQDGRFKINRIMIAGCYNLLDTSASVLFSICKEKNIELYIAAPYAGGILSGQPGNVFYKYAEASNEIKQKVKNIETVCKEFDIPFAHAAMQFVVKQTQIAKIVVGARTRDEFSKSLYYANHSLPLKFWETLDNKGLIPSSSKMINRSLSSGSIFADNTQQFVENPNQQITQSINNNKL